MRLRRHAWWLTAVAAFALAALLRATGSFQALEYALSDARDRALLHTVDSDIVIVGIDAKSLAALDHWPWPRRQHAALIGRLDQAAPGRVFLDIDFSSQSNALDDAALESALAAWRHEPVILPVFFQPSSATPHAGLRLTRPLSRFLPHVRLAAVNRLPADDGLERSWRSSWSAGKAEYPSVLGLVQELPPGAAIPIDYSISPRSFEYVSFVELLAGRVPAARLAGKTIFVGATAVELGDMVPVPVHRSLPGVVAQALAVESVRAGPLRTPAPWVQLAALAAWACLLAAALRGRKWRRSAAFVAVALPALAGAALYLHVVHRCSIEIVPLAFVTAAVFLGLVLRSLDEQTWRAITYALGMRRRDALLKSIVQSSSDCIVCIDSSGAIRTANPAAESLFGRPAGELVGAPIARYLPGLGVAPGDENRALEALDGRISEWEASNAAGREFPVELAVSRVRFRDEHLYTAIIRNVSERKAQQRRLEHQATHDALTQLPNRAALMQRLDQALTGGPREGLSVLMLDLCRFKEVNDTLGHHVGDEVLREVGRRFQTALGERGFIARIGGDEFSAIVVQHGAQGVVEELCRSAAASLQRPVDVAGVSIDLGVSIGVARCPQDASDAATLLRQADVAMYLAKRRGTAFEFYDVTQDGNTLRRLSMVGELRAAIEREELELHYQPKVDLRTGQATGVEALLRWPHPVHGLVSPAEFVAFAETTDLIRPLTEWSLRRALADRRDWQSGGLDLRVAVNLSARLLQDAAFPQRLRALLEEAQARPSALEVEITESAMMADPDRALRIVQDIHRLGVAIAIDDFGSGYSSLAYLRDLPVGVLKLDKSFVTGMRARAGDRVIVESTAQMAHALRLQVVAEGVETDWEARFLAAAGYDYGQGYHFSAALPAGDCAAWVARHNGARRAPEPARRLAVARR